MLIAHGLALAVAFALLSALHVVIGELVPKTLSLARAERVALLIALAIFWFPQDISLGHLSFGRPFPTALSKRSASPRRRATASHTPPRSCRFRFSRRASEDLLAPGEEKFIVSAIELTQVQVREIMVPRPDMHTLPVEVDAR